MYLNYQYPHCVPATQLPYIRQYVPKEDIDLSLYLAALCYQGYQLISEREIVLPTWRTVPEPTAYLTKFCGSSLLGSEEAFGFVIESNTSIYLVFRGTQNASDWSANLDARMTNFDYVPYSGKVHARFNTIYSSMRPAILSKINSLNPRKTLYITGHSLGGALATLCTLDMAVNSNFPQPVIATFAAPRVGNDVFATKFNDTINRSIRVINAQDHVPVVPPPEIGFVHVKGGITIDVYAGANPLLNHGIKTGYWPGLVKLDPVYAAQLCTMNPPGFCPLSVNASSSFYQRF